MIMIRLVTVERLDGTFTSGVSSNPTNHGGENLDPRRAEMNWTRAHILLALALVAAARSLNRPGPEAASRDSLPLW